MEDKIREEKGLEADFVYDGYNKANLMAAAEKDPSDKKPETCQEALGDTPKKASQTQDSSVVFSVLLGVLAVCGFSLAGFFYKKSKNKEDE